MEIRRFPGMASARSRAKGGIGLIVCGGPSNVSIDSSDIFVRKPSGAAGLGLIQVPRYRVEHQIAAGQLIPVLKGFPPPPMPVSVLYPQCRHLSSRVKVFVDWLSELFRSAETLHS